MAADNARTRMGLGDAVPLTPADAAHVDATLSAKPSRRALQVSHLATFLASGDASRWRDPQTDAIDWIATHADTYVDAADAILEAAMLKHPNPEDR